MCYMNFSFFQLLVSMPAIDDHLRSPHLRQRPVPVPPPPRPSLEDTRSMKKSRKRWNLGLFHWCFLVTPKKGRNRKMLLFKILISFIDCFFWNVIYVFNIKVTCKNAGLFVFKTIAFLGFKHWNVTHCCSFLEEFAFQVSNNHDASWNWKNV